MASVLKVPQQEAAKILQKDGYRLDIPTLVQKTGIPRSTLLRYLHNGLETTPLWAVCRIMKAVHMTDEDRLQIIRCYSGE